MVRPGDAPRGQLRHRPRTARGHRLAKLRCMDPAALARPPADAAVFCPLRGLSRQAPSRRLRLGKERGDTRPQRLCTQRGLLGKGRAAPKHGHRHLLPLSGPDAGAHCPAQKGRHQRLFPHDLGLLHAPASGHGPRVPNRQLQLDARPLFCAAPVPQSLRPAHRRTGRHALALAKPGLRRAD